MYGAALAERSEGMINRSELNALGSPVPPASSLPWKTLFRPDVCFWVSRVRISAGLSPGISCQLETILGPEGVLCLTV